MYFINYSYKLEYICAETYHKELQFSLLETELSW